ncbi:hypothetical protein A2U01_0102030, partial [Trifolium medium]|nr:hypothetical protein [Trifolium medium]
GESSSLESCFALRALPPFAPQSSPNSLVAMSFAEYFGLNNCEGGWLYL